MDAHQFYGARKAGQNPLTDRINSIWNTCQNSKGVAVGRPAKLLPFTSSLLGPTVVWKTFPRQAEALEYAAGAGADVHVFAYECLGLSDGRRRYLVTSYEHFWHTYKQVADENRHHYEIITENVPVKLYFDLEFSREANTQRNGDEMVDLLLEELDATFQEVYSKPLSCHDMVQLDASTPTKFSQHLIFPSVVFQDIFHAGFFVSYLCQRITNSYEQNQPSERSSLLEKLLIRKKEDSHSVLFVDQGVYTKNRNFRLFKSSKLKKNNPLVLTVDCPLQEKTEREIFFLSLICNNVRVDLKEDVMVFDCQKHPLPANLRSKNTGLGKKPIFPSQTGSLASPFPEVDKFFELIITSNGVRGRIRQWQYFGETETLLYAISGDYRYCERIGRHHQSNNILFVASLRMGTYHQKCLDSDCRLVDFRSQDYALPVKLISHPNFDGVSVESNQSSGNFSENFDREGDEFLAKVPLDFELL